MKRLLCGSALGVLGLFLLPVQSAQAACYASGGYYKPGDCTYSAQTERFGAYSSALAGTGAGSSATWANCDFKQTDWTQSDGQTTELSDSSTATSTKQQPYYQYGDFNLEAVVSTTASMSDFSVSAQTNYTHNTWTRQDSWGQVVDLVLIKNENALSTDDAQLHGKFCSKYESQGQYTGSTSNKSRFNSKLAGTYNGEAQGGDSLTYDDSSSTSSYTYHTGAGQVCRDTTLNVRGKYAYFSMGLFTSTQGSYTPTPYTTTGGAWGTATSNLNTGEGRIEASFDMGSLPAGYTCFSASGAFPNCERPLPPNLLNVAGVNAMKAGSGGGSGTYTGALGGGLNSVRESTGVVITGGVGSGSDFGPQVNAAVNALGETCPASTGNPINFAYGFKHKSQADYRGGALSFTRHYRSDDTWSSGVMGVRWRHNYDRGLNIIATPESTSIDVKAADGSVISFREGASDVWSAFDLNTTQTLDSVFDGGTHTGYLYTTNADTQEYYDLDGLLTRIEYRGNEAIDLSYDGSDRLTSITNEKGKTISLSYNAQDRIASAVTPSGTFSYGYDGSGNLTSVTKPDMEVMSYLYQDTNYPYALTGLVDENGVTVESYTYDVDGRAIATEFNGGVETFDIAYNTDETTTVTNELGKDTIYHFETINGERKIVLVDGQASANCVASSKAYTYDDRGFLESKTDWKGNVTSYLRDDRGLVTSMTVADGLTEAQTTSYTHDAVLRLPDVVTQTGKTVDYDYDSDGRVTSMTVTDTATAQTRVTSYSYNANTTDANGNVVLGRVASVNGSRTDVTDTTSYTYDANNRRIKTTNALGHESEVISFDSANRPLTVEDVNAVQTVFVYDALGRVASSTAAYGTASAATTSYTYDDNGNVLTVTSPNGAVTTNTYDGARRLVSVSDALGNMITYTHDAAGNVLTETYKDSSATLKYTMSQTYDELSRLLKSTTANLDETTNVYDVNSNVTSTTDGNSNATAYAFDGLNRLVSETDALSGVTAHGLNELDQKESVTDPRSNVTSYTYNAFGEVLTEVSPDRGTRSYSYDSGGNMVSMTDGRGVVSNYSYDAINRVASVSYPSDSSLNQSFTYDAISGCGMSTGRLCSVTDAGGTSSYVYDELGRVTSVTETRGSQSFTTSYGYDAAGVLTSITLPSGRTVAYTLNANGQVSGLTATVGGSTQTIASGVTYLPFGGVTGLTFGNSIALTNTYDTAYQLTSKQHGSLMYDSYSYDGAGNITVKGATSYTFDPLYRLTAEGSDSYSYDGIGNRLSRNSDSYSYSSTDSILDAINGSSLTTDAGGNITADTSRTYTIDAAGHVKEVKIGGSVVGAYTYDANNQRTKKVASGVTTHYVHGAGGLLYGEYDASGAMIREYVYFNNQPIAQIDTGEVLSYLHTDHLGTPRYASNTSGSQVWAWSSDAFGNGVPTGSATVNLRFAGQYFDKESDLHYNWNRYYDPDTGRYISSDPIGLAGGLNTFAYVGANPVMHVDPEGLLRRGFHCPDNDPARCSLVGPRGVEGHDGEGTWWQGQVTANDGTNIVAYKNATYDPRFDTNCHGTSLGNGDVWIQGAQVKDLLKAEGYQRVLFDTELMRPGSIILFAKGNKVLHTTTVVRVGDRNDFSKVIVKGLDSVEIDTSVKTLQSLINKYGKASLELWR